MYATFAMGGENPLPYAGAPPATEQPSTASPVWVMPESFPPPPTGRPGGQPRGRQFLTLGQAVNGEFKPAVRFGIHDGRSLPLQPGTMYTYLQDGHMEYYGLWVRPNTPYDFKVRLDLAAQRMTVWVSGRGDDDWYLLAENTPLIAPVTAINQTRVVQYPDAAGIPAVRVQDQPWAAGESVRPHPLAKADQVVGAECGFRFQSMRSTWELPGRHVTICRQPELHFGFPDVAQTGPTTLMCVFSNGSYTGSQGGSSICLSHGLGWSWSEPAPCPGGGRVQVLADGRPVVEGAKAWYTSADGGVTWTPCFDFDQEARASGGPGSQGPCRHIAELFDGSWMMVGSSFPGGYAQAWTGTEGEQLEFFRSTDQGQTWDLLSTLQPYPPRSLSEASLLELPYGRLVVYAREDRNDGFPALRAFSADAGETWQVADLPFAMTGRTCAKFLRDGRVMITFRSNIGRSGLRAWVGEVNDPTPFLTSGAHFNDHHSVRLQEGALHIDSDGVRGQFTQYFLRQPDTAESKIDVTVEVKVVANSGRAATLSVPFVGQLRFFPDHMELAEEPSVRAEVTPGTFHTYRVVREGGLAELYVDGRLAVKTDKVDARTEPQPWAPANTSLHPLAFGNEPSGHEAPATPNLMPYHLPVDVTGYSIWRRMGLVLDDPPHRGVRQLLVGRAGRVPRPIPA